MVRVRRVVVVGEVAVGAGSTQPRKLSVDVALLARHVDVEPGQREPRQRVVIKLRPCPAGSVVASGAGRREARRLVARARRVVVVGDVARGAVRRRPCEPAIDMALLARHINVEPGQREPRQRVVVKLRPRPAGSVVASGAGCREARRLVVRVRRVVVVGEVA